MGWLFNILLSHHLAGSVLLLLLASCFGNDRTYSICSYIILWEGLLPCLFAYQGFLSRWCEPRSIDAEQSPTHHLSAPIDLYPPPSFPLPHYISLELFLGFLQGFLPQARDILRLFLFWSSAATKMARFRISFKMNRKAKDKVVTLNACMYRFEDGPVRAGERRGFFAKFPRLSCPNGKQLWTKEFIIWSIRGGPAAGDYVRVNRQGRAVA